MAQPARPSSARIAGRRRTIDVPSGSEALAFLPPVARGCATGCSAIRVGALPLRAVCSSGAAWFALSARGFASADGAGGGNGSGASLVLRLLVSRVAQLLMAGLCGGCVCEAAGFVGAAAV